MDIGSINDFKKKILTRTLNTLNNNNTNLNMDNQSKTSINSNPLKYIYDEEFISSINSLSNSIKNYFQKNKIYLGNIKLISENINEQVIFSKGAINDILIYFNQIRQARNNNLNLSFNSNEKYLKEKMRLISERIEKINEFKINMLSNIKNCEICFISFFEEAKELFKKMKVIRTEKIENFNKKIIVNKNYNNNFKYNNTNIYRPQKASSVSPSHKSNTINQQSKLIKENQNGNSINTRNVINFKNDNNIIKINNNDANNFNNLKIKYLELVQENKKLKEEISIMNNKTYYKQSKKINIINSENPSRNSSSYKKSSSAKKKKYIQKPLSIGNIKNKSKKINKSISHSRIQNQTQSQTTNISSSLVNEENTDIKLIKSSNKKMDSIPVGNEKENNILSISKNSMDKISASGDMGESIRINYTMNNTLSNNINLASMVLSFLNDMKTLQEKITQKVHNIKDFKKNFEIKKRELKKFSENIIDKNFSATYSNNNINNLMTENIKSKSKEQSMKASIESFNMKENINYNEIIKEYENKNNEQNNIILNKEKDIEKLKNDIIEKDNIIKKIEKEVKEKEEKIKTEKEISNLKDDKLNSEKAQNKSMNEEILILKEKNQKMEIELQKAINEINNLEKINKQLDTIQTQQKNIIEDLTKKSKTEVNKFNVCKEELEKYKLSEKENISLKNENLRLKQQITQCNSNLVTISNTNESIIHEKDKIIKNFSNNIKELNKQIDLLNNEISKHGNNLSQSTILAEEISTLRKNNDNSQQKIQELINENKQLKNKIADIKSNYISHDEDFENIKKVLNELNNRTESNLKKLKENEKKFEECCGSNRQNKNCNIEFNDDIIININNNMKEIKDNTGQFRIYLDEIKNINNKFSEFNNINK